MCLIAGRWRRFYSDTSNDFDRMSYKSLFDMRGPDLGCYERIRSLTRSPMNVQATATARSIHACVLRALCCNNGGPQSLRHCQRLGVTFSRRFGYTLQMTASGADRWRTFCLRQSRHCEYSRLPMAVMYKRGYRITCGQRVPAPASTTALLMYSPQQSDAHSWVEVYFPESNAWVTFDPTPAAGRTEPKNAGSLLPWENTPKLLNCCGFSMSSVTTARSSARWQRH